MWKGTTPTNLCQTTRVITLSCGISYFASSQSTRVTDRRIDRERERDGQIKLRSQNRAIIAALRGKNRTDGNGIVCLCLTVFNFIGTQERCT